MSPNRTAVFLVDLLDDRCAEFVRAALRRLGVTLALAETGACRCRLGMYFVQRSEASSAVQLRTVYKTGSLNLREWDAATVKVQACEAVSVDTKKLAMCLKSLTSLLPAEAAAASYTAVHVISTGFCPTAYLSKIAEDAADRNIHISFTSLRPLGGPEGDAGHRGAAEAGAAAAGAASSLPWKSGGVTLQLEPALAAFMAGMSYHENCSVDVCLAEPLMAERQSQQWLQQLLPPLPPSSVVLRLPGGALAAGDGAAAAAGPDQPPPPPRGMPATEDRLLHFQVSSQILRLHADVRQPDVCPCHGVPVSREGSAPGFCSVTQAPSSATTDDEVQGIGVCQFLRTPKAEAGQGSSRQGGHMQELRVERVVLASSLSESLTYGWPHLLLPSQFDLDSDEEVLANRRSIAALAQVMQQQDAAFLASSFLDLDTGLPSLVRQWYMLVPPRGPLPGGAAPEPGPAACVPGAAASAPFTPGAAVPAPSVPCFLAKHLACREQLVPVPSCGPSDPLSEAEVESARRCLVLVPGAPGHVSGAAATAQGAGAATLVPGAPGHESLAAAAAPAQGAGAAAAAQEAAESSPCHSEVLEVEEVAECGRPALRGSSSAPCAGAAPAFSPMDISSGAHELIADMIRRSSKPLGAAAPKAQRARAAPAQQEPQAHAPTLGAAAASAMPAVPAAALPLPHPTAEGSVASAATGQPAAAEGGCHRAAPAPAGVGRGQQAPASSHKALPAKPGRTSLQLHKPGSDAAGRRSG